MRRLALARPGPWSVLRRLMSVHRWPVLWKAHADVHSPLLCPQRATTYKLDSDRFSRLYTEHRRPMFGTMASFGLAMLLFLSSACAA